MCKYGDIKIKTKFRRTFFDTISEVNKKTRNRPVNQIAKTEYNKSYNFNNHSKVHFYNALICTWYDNVSYFSLNEM